MTEARKLKKAVRARARKTGESYAAARRSYLKPPAPRPAAPPAKPGAPGSLSDANALEKTGHGLDHWFAVLDKFSKGRKGHTDAARHLYEEHGMPGWHAQGITVAWERARGHRAMNQSCDGDFQVSVSRVVPVGVADIVRAFTERKQRAVWLKNADPGLVRALAAGLEGEKSKGLRIINAERARLRFRWDGGVVQIYVDAKPGGKTSIVAQNEDLSDAASVETRRAAWRDALNGLRSYLTS